jgi:hypothetical protein
MKGEISLKFSLGSDISYMVVYAVSSEKNNVHTSQNIDIDTLTHVQLSHSGETPLS